MIARLSWGALLLVLTLSSPANLPAQQNPNLVLSWTPSQQQSVNVAKITSLKVRIITDRRRGAGTDNAVYFDVGPLAWKLNKSFHNDFESGSDDTYELKEVPTNFTINDILWLRLHKKGLLGVTGTKDGFDGAWHPKTLVLIVNGVEFRRAEVDTPLNSTCWYWRSPEADTSDLNLFARSLRMIPNKKLNFLDKFSGFLTTPLFKRNGISGWIPDPSGKQCGLSPANSQPAFPSSLCVTGEVLQKATSTDGLQ